MTWPVKDPNDILDYSIDWTGRLNGDTITKSEWILPAGLVLGETTHDATRTTAWISGGTIRDYQVTNRITTAGGRQHDHSATLSVQNR